jgi:N-acetylneuraminic acid mutarotase
VSRAPLLLLLLLLAGVALAQGRVSPAGALSVARVNHTATLLRDGRVLVTGGRTVDGLSTLASAEVFDPKTRGWKLVPSMAVGRSHHAATLLADGRVLVTGGTSADPDPQAARFIALASAELYDPVLNRWFPAAPLHEARNGHTATLLADGSVLVVGGAREQRALLTSVERYEPTQNAWSLAPSLQVERSLHAAVRLRDGSVVVMGGRGHVTRADGGVAISPLESVERFDPGRGGWAAVAPMTEARQRMGAVALDDGVVVLGGQTTTSSTNLAEAWSPALETSTWRPLENHLSMALAAHTATLLPNRDLLVVGGEPPNQVDTARVQRWKYDSKQWCLAAQLKTSRKAHTATLLKDGRVLVVGGTSGGVPEASAELWEDAKGKCEEPSGVSLEW